MECFRGDSPGGSRNVVLDRLGGELVRVRSSRSQLELFDAELAAARVRSGAQRVGSARGVVDALLSGDRDRELLDEVAVAAVSPSSVATSVALSAVAGLLADAIRRRNEQWCWGVQVVVPAALMATVDYQAGDSKPFQLRVLDAADRGLHRDGRRDRRRAKSSVSVGGLSAVETAAVDASTLGWTDERGAAGSFSLEQLVTVWDFQAALERAGVDPSVVEMTVATRSLGISAAEWARTFGMQAGTVRAIRGRAERRAAAHLEAGLAA